MHDKKSSGPGAAASTSPAEGADLLREALSGARQKVLDGLQELGWDEQQQALDPGAPAPGQAPAKPAAVERTTLRYGARGAAVEELQRLLNGHAAGLAVDGAFGPATYKAVVNFQRAKGLAVDGVVGKNTWGSLDDAPAPGGNQPGGEQPGGNQPGGNQPAVAAVAVAVAAAVAVVAMVDPGIRTTS